MRTSSHAGARRALVGLFCAVVAVPSYARADEHALRVDGPFFPQYGWRFYTTVDLHGWSTAGDLVYVAEKEQGSDESTWWRTRLLAVKTALGLELYKDALLVPKDPDGPEELVDVKSLHPTLVRLKLAPEKFLEIPDYGRAWPRKDGVARVRGLGPLTNVCGDVRWDGSGGCRSPDGRWTFVVRHVEGGAPMEDDNRCRPGESLTLALVPTAPTVGGEVVLERAEPDRMRPCGTWMGPPRLQASWSADSRRLAVSAELGRSNENGYHSYPVRLSVYDVAGMAPATADAAVVAAPPAPRDPRPSDKHGLRLDADLFQGGPPRYLRIALRGWSRAGELAYAAESSGVLACRSAREVCEWMARVLAVRSGADVKIYRDLATTRAGAGKRKAVTSLAPIFKTAHLLLDDFPGAKEFERARPAEDGVASLAAVGPLTPVCELGRADEAHACPSPDGVRRLVVRRVQPEGKPSSRHCRPGDKLAFVVVSSSPQAASETVLLSADIEEDSGCEVLQKLDHQASWSADSRKVAIASADRLDVLDVAAK